MVPSLVEFLEDCFQEMRFQECGLSFDPESTWETIRRTTENGGFLALEMDAEGISGVFAALVAPNLANHRELRAVEYVWHSRPDLKLRQRVVVMKKLLARAENWARENRHYLTVSTSAHRPALERLLTAAGYSPLEKTFGKDFSNGH